MDGFAGGLLVGIVLGVIVSLGTLYFVLGSRSANEWAQEMEAMRRMHNKPYDHADRGDFL